MTAHARPLDLLSLATEETQELMQTPYKIADYCKQYEPEWTCTMRRTPLALHMVAHTPVPDVKPNNAEDMRRLTLTNTLEYYDVPQILTAADATGTRYLCAPAALADGETMASNNSATFARGWNATTTATNSYYKA